MQKRRILIILLAVGILIIWRQLHQPEASQIQLQTLTGQCMGPIPYQIKYMGESTYQEEVDSILTAFNRSLSTYVADSELSRLNQSGSMIYESPFMYPVLAMSREAYLKSNGDFDPTIGPLVRAWGFGKDDAASLDSARVDSLLEFVGYDRVKFDQDSVSIPQGFYLNFSASAKGYAVDLVAEYLVKNGVTDYMVEIGGEVACSGKNRRGNIWRIGVQKPLIGAQSNEKIAISFLKNQAMATSGNYRNYRMENDVMVAHTIDPKTGFSKVQNLLSASVYAPNCTMADAYATACMVKGVEESKKMINRLPGVECFLVYSDIDGTIQWYASKGVADQIQILIDEESD